ncbi:hypothetical protein CEXT_792571 [Caerostris extrusa]|uniref:Uncharacterized protein n=1 Tax=Caerostris extrusa TaxID=172846 RepID=A0AAV4QYT2_CAEEX|nr:hypothetical protein CEXT_792571 [Caerostris extrusa]
MWPSNSSTGYLNLEVYLLSHIEPKTPETMLRCLLEVAASTSSFASQPFGRTAVEGIGQKLRPGIWENKHFFGLSIEQIGLSMLPPKEIQIAQPALLLAPLKPKPYLTADVSDSGADGLRQLQIF